MEYQTSSFFYEIPDLVIIELMQDWPFSVCVRNPLCKRLGRIQIKKKKKEEEEEEVALQETVEPLQVWLALCPTFPSMSFLSWSFRQQSQYQWMEIQKH